ncbi:MAG: polyprenyl synthetase family protein, partial [Ardenticatenaceae bacterium]
LHYHLGWANARYESEALPGGKRVRPVLCLMSCEAFTGMVERALPAAVAVELLHAFSLIHDDIEDGDRCRWHRPTLWTLVGQPQAINAGDGLFALAQSALLRSAEEGIPAETVLEALARFNEAALQLCIGQHLDMTFEARAVVSPEEYLEMIQGKTASLLAYAGAVGAVMGGAGEAEVAALYEMGEALGLAFQMQDDLLGLWGDPQRTGKPVGADIRARKKSLPVAYALSQPGSERLRTLYASPIETDEQVAEANRLIESTGAHDYTKAQVRHQAARAAAMLDTLSASQERLAPLRRLVELLTHRNR